MESYEPTRSFSEIVKSAFVFFHQHHFIVCIIFGLVFGYILIRQWMIGRVRDTVHARMDGRTVLITGGNSGIGKATAEQLMRRGARVIIACRDLKKGREAMDEISSRISNVKKRRSGDVRKLDLASLQSVRDFVEKFLKEEDHLNILINNAGVYCIRSESKDGYELQFAVNHLGHFLLTNLLLDLLEKSSPSRIITVSSDAYKYGTIHFDDINIKKDYASYVSYSQSKLANILFTRALARRLEGSGVTANSLHPGMVDTDLTRNFDMEPGGILTVLLIRCFKLILKVFGNTPEQGSRTTVYCAVAPELQLVTGKYFNNSREVELAPHAMDLETEERLWTVSEQMVKLRKQD